MMMMMKLPQTRRDGWLRCKADSCVVHRKNEQLPISRRLRQAILVVVVALTKYQSSPVRPDTSKKPARDLIFIAHLPNNYYFIPFIIHLPPSLAPLPPTWNNNNITSNNNYHDSIIQVRSRWWPETEERSHCDIQLANCIPGDFNATSLRVASQQAGKSLNQFF